MAKINPYAASTDEMKAMIAERDAFAFDEPVKKQHIILIAGQWGTGKTHLACTMTELGPVYIVDTEDRAQVVAKKYLAQGKDVRAKTIKSWREMVVAVKAIIQKYPPGTIIIDSGSDLQVFAEIAYLERTKQDKIYPLFNWTEVWSMCNALIDDIKASGNHLVVTARVKDEYIGDKSTGRVVPRIYASLPYKCDFVLQLNEPKKPATVLKNGYDMNYMPAIQINQSLPRIAEILAAGPPAQK